MQPKTPLFTSDSQHPPRFRHAVYLGVVSDVILFFGTCYNWSPVVFDCILKDFS